MNELEMLILALIVYLGLSAAAYAFAYSPREKIIRAEDDRTTPVHATTPRRQRRTVVTSLAASLAGAIGIVGGVELFLRGALGAEGWTVKMNDRFIHLNDLLSAVLLLAAGVFILFASRHNVVFEAVERRRARRGRSGPNHGREAALHR